MSLPLSPTLDRGLLLDLPDFQTFQRPCNKYPDHVCGAILLCRSTQFSNFLHLRSAPYVNLPQEQMKCTKETCHNNLGMPEVGRGQGGPWPPRFLQISITISHPGGQTMPIRLLLGLITTRPPGFSDLPTGHVIYRVPKIVEFY